MADLRIQHTQVIPPIPVTQFSLPKSLVDLLMRLLEKDPANRPESAAMVARELESIRDAFYNPRNTVADPVLGASGDKHVYEDSGLIFRAYVPSDRLYAAELDKFLSLFRGWLSSVRGNGVRQGGYETRTGKVYEFYLSEDSADIDLDQERADFSEFLAMCVSDPPAAAERLVQEGMGRSEAASFASRYGREIRRLNLDLRHERERRVLEIWHSIESDLIDSDAYSDVVVSRLKEILDSLVPDLSVNTYRNILEVGDWSEQAVIKINVNQQIISAVEGIVIQNVGGGTVNLGLQAKELLALIEAYGGAEANSLRTALYEVEDKDAPVTKRREAKNKISDFLRQVGGVAKDVAVDLLESYLEKKLGM